MLPRRLVLTLLLLASCSRSAATNTAASPETSADAPDRRVATTTAESAPPPLLPPVEWPELAYRFPDDIAFIQRECVVTVKGEAFCRGIDHAPDYVRVAAPDVELVHAAAYSPGCRAASDGGAACTAAYRAAKRSTREDLHGAPLVDAIDIVRWNRRGVFGGQSIDPYKPKYGGRVPREPEGVVQIDCISDDGYDGGLIWLSKGKVDSRCGYDTGGWRDIVQLSGRSGVICGLQRDGDLRCLDADSDEPPFPAITAAAEVSVGQYMICVRMKAGTVTCSALASDLPLVGEPPKGIGRQLIELGIRGATAVSVDTFGVCIATGDTLHCEGTRAAYSDAAIAVRGPPPVVAATRMKRGGVAIDTQGETVVWGEATRYVPERASRRLAVVGAGVALTRDDGDLVEYDAATGNWLTRILAFWPDPPADVRLARTTFTVIGGATVDGCAKSSDELRCWKTEKDPDGPFVVDDSKEAKALAVKAFLASSRTLGALEDIQYRDPDVAIDSKGRLWFDGPYGTEAWQRPPRWIPQAVRNGREGPRPQLELRPDKIPSPR